MWTIRAGDLNHPTPVKIEDSLYFASYDKILESKCILVEGTLKDKVNNINWALEKTN